MARVSYDPVNTVSPTGPARENPGESASPAEFGALGAQAEQRAGQDLEQGASNLNQSAVMIQDRYNQVATDNAFNQYQKGLLNLTYGDSNGPKNPDGSLQKPGFYSLRGQDAMNAMKPTSDAIDQMRTQISGTLNTAQNVEFQQAARRLQMFTLDSMGRHYDQQFQNWTTNVNTSMQNTSNTAIANGWNNETNFQNELQGKQRAAVREVQNAGLGNNPDSVNAAMTKATNDAYKIRTLAWGNNDPSGALDYMKKNESSFAPNDFRMLSNEFQNKKDAADTTAGINDIMSGNVPHVVPAAAIGNAIHGQEGTPPGVTSKQGAQSSWQIEPATFKQYAQPGEQLSNEADANAVGHRIIADYTQKYGGDPARVAVAYFSGPGNVAPPGSPTPWKTDNHDGNNFYTSQYVNGVLRRLGQGGNYPTQGETIDANNPAPKLRGITASIPSMSPAAMSALFDDDPALKAKQAAQEEQQGASLSAPQQPTADMAQQPAMHQVQLASMDANAMQLAMDQHGAAAFTPQKPPPSPAVLNMQPPANSPPALQQAQPQAASPNHNPAAYTAEEQQMVNGWAYVRQKYPNNIAQQHAIMSGVQEQIQFTNSMQAKYEAEQARALRENQESAGKNILQSVHDNPGQFDYNSILHDPYLSKEQMQNLWDFADKHVAQTGSHDTKTFGDGWWKAFSDISRPDGDPQKITDPYQLLKRAGPGGDLTYEGVKEGTNLIEQKRTPQGEANATMLKTFMQSVKSQLTLSNDYMTDPKGDTAFLKFQASAFPLIEANQKSGKVPYGQFLIGPEMKALVDNATRPPAVQASDAMATNHPAGWFNWLTGGGPKASPAGTPAFNYGAPNAPTYDRGALETEMRRRGLLGAQPQAQPQQPPVPQ